MDAAYARCGPHAGTGRGHREHAREFLSACRDDTSAFFVGAHDRRTQRQRREVGPPSGQRAPGAFAFAQRAVRVDLVDEALIEGCSRFAGGLACVVDGLLAVGAQAGALAALLRRQGHATQCAVPAATPARQMVTRLKRVRFVRFVG